MRDGKGKVVQDHLGNTYPSVAAMCRAYGLPERSNFYHRINKGWSLEKALTMPIALEKHPIRCKDKIYESYADFTRATGISRRTYLRRKNMGFTADEIVEISRNKTGSLGMYCKDHLGNKYPSFAAMARAWHKHVDVVRKRLERGASIKQALTAKVYKEVTPHG